MKNKFIRFFVILILILFLGLPFLTGCDSKTDLPPVIEVEKVTVQFDSVGGSLVSKQILEIGGKATKPSNPVKTDYTFNGWYKDKNYIEEWRFDKNVVEENIILYAKWESIEYHIVTILDMYSTEIDVLSVKNGEDVPLPVPPKVPGYYFTGWNGKVTNITTSGTIQATYKRLTTAAEIQNGQESTEITFEGQVVAKHAVGVLLKDDTGFVLLYDTEIGYLKINDYIRLKATISSFASKKQLKNPKEIEVLEVKEKYEPVIEEPSPSNPVVGQYIEYKGILTKSGTHYNINIDDYFAFSLAYPLENLDSYVGKTVEFSGYTLYMNYQYLNIMLVDIKEAEVNRYSVTFLDEEGNVLDEQLVPEGMDATPPAAPVKDGYTFIGWIGGDYKNVKENMVLTPQYNKGDQILELSILEVNDLHGYLEQQSGKTGISNLAYLINSIRSENGLDDVVLIGNGDMFQGTGISNITRGKAVIDCMNAMNFDAMGLGNHEFDWGLNEILKYFDGDPSNGEANFPLLNANVYLKATNELVIIQDGNMFQYRIIDKSGVKVAIISYIGNVITSIAYERREPYYFDNNIAASVQKIALPLKENGLADIVIVNIHDGESTGANDYQVNLELAELTYSKGWLVDAVINGHTHTRYTGMISRAGVALPVVQAQSYCRYLGRINLSIDMDSKKVVAAESLYLSNYSYDYDREVQSILDQAISEINNEEFCVLGDTVSKTSDLQKWHGYTAIQATGADVFVSNVGGIRATGGIQQGKVINLFNIYEISPFDNVLYLLTTTQSKAAKLLSSSSVFYVTKDDMELDNNQEYTYAIISYVYFWSQLDSVRSERDIQTELVIRDLLIEDLRYRRDHNIAFNPVTNPNSVLGPVLNNSINLYPIYCDLNELRKSQLSYSC